MNSIFKSSGSLLLVSQLAAKHGYRLVAVRGKGHKSAKGNVLSLADIQALVSATNAGLLFRDELNAIIEKHNHSLNAKYYIQLSHSANGEITYHVN